MEAIKQEKQGNEQANEGFFLNRKIHTIHNPYIMAWLVWELFFGLVIYRTIYKLNSGRVIKIIKINLKKSSIDKSYKHTYITSWHSLCPNSITCIMLTAYLFPLQRTALLKYPSISSSLLLKFWVSEIIIVSKFINSASKTPLWSQKE